jgi:hypothetical protein
MHHRLIALAALAAAVPAGAATRNYIVTDFDTVRLEGPIEVDVRTGRGVSARGEGDADLLERIDLQVSARVLTIRLKPAFTEARRAPSTAPARLTLGVPNLRRIQLSGAGSLKADGLDRLRAEVVSSGSGSLAVSGIASDNLTVVQVGPGSVQLAGRAKSVAMQVSGSGSLAAGRLVASDLDLAVEGAGSVAASADRSAKIIATGSGSVAIAGKAACTVRQSGSGTVNCGS